MRFIPKSIVFLFLLFCISLYAEQDYPNALHLSTRFYGAQRCGHNVQSWIGHDSCHWQDKFELTDASGGWHDCGDHIKFAQTGGYAATLLLHSYLTFPASFKDNYSPAYSTGASNGIPDILDEVKYYTDYALKMLSADEKKLLFQVGFVEFDHSSCSAPEYQTESESASNGGGTRIGSFVTDSGASNVAGLHAAVLSMMSMAYKEYDAAYADSCLQQAIKLYHFGNHAHVAQSSVDKEGKPDGTYTDTTWADDMALGAIELFRATNDSSYLDEVINIFLKSGNYPFPTYFVLDYPNVSPLVEYEIAKHVYPTTANKNKLKTEANSYLDSMTTAGFAFFGDWGSLKYSAAASYVALLTTDLFPTDTTYISFAQKNCNFILGDHNGIGNDAPKGFSFLSGYSASHVTGTPVEQLHHAGAFGGEPGVFGDGSGEWGDANTANKNTLNGAVVGGPTSRNGGYNNYRNDAITNEVCIYYNAPFVGSLAGLIEFNTIEQDTTPPEPIIGLTRLEVGKEVISYSWTPSSSSDADSLVIGWGNNITSVNDALAGDHVVLSNASSSYKITGLSPNTTYVVAFYVKDKNNNWSNSVTQSVTTDAVVSSNYILDDFENYDYGLDVLNYSRGSWYLFDDQAPSWDQSTYNKYSNKYTDSAMLEGGNSHFTNFDAAYLEIHKASNGSVLKMEQKYEEVTAKSGAGYDNSNGLELKFKFGDKQPHWGHDEDATYPGFIGFGTGLMPEGKFAALDGTMAITFRAKASHNIDMEMALLTNQPVIKRHGNFYKVKNIEVGTDWVEYTIPIKTGDAPNDFNQYNWWDADTNVTAADAFWGWEARNSSEFVQLIEEPAKFSKAEKIQWSFINDDSTLVGTEITFWIDDIIITNYAPTFDDQLSTSNWGYQQQNPDTDKKELYTSGNRNKLSADNIWYAYNDAKNRTDITSPATALDDGVVTDIEAVSNCSMRWNNYIYPELLVNTTAAYPEVGYSLGQTFIRNIDAKDVRIFPFMAIGMETRYNYYEYYNASSYNGVSFRYKTTGSNSARYQLRLHDTQALTAEGASFLINVPATGGAWKEITVSFDDIDLPWWDTEDRGKSFRKSYMSSIEFAIEGVPSDQGTIAVDDIYFVTNAQSSIPDLNVVDTLPPFVAIKERNQKPTNITLSSNTVLEGSPERTFIGRLSTTDANSSDTHTYVELVSDTGNVIISGDSLFTSQHFAQKYQGGDTVLVQIKSTDPFEASITKSFNIIVVSSGTNHQPTNITLTPATVADTAVAGTYVGKLTTADEDAGDTHSYTEFVDGSAKVRISSDSLFTNSYFKSTYRAGDTARVKIKSTDNAGAWIVKTLSISVTGTVVENHAPTMDSVKAQTIKEDSTITLYLSMTNAQDIDGDSLQLQVLAGANYTVSGTTVSPVQNYNGTLTVPVTVTDGKLNSDTLPMTITVTPVNDAPTLDSLTTQTVGEDSSLTITLSMVKATDVDGDTLSVIVQSGSNYNVSGTTITPTANFTGTLQVPLVVSDGKLVSNTKVMNVTVSPVNDKPVLESVTAQTMAEDDSLTVTLAMVSAKDADGDALSISLQSGANYTVSGTTVKPALNFHGTLQVQLAVSDGKALSNGGIMSITVTPVNDAPKIDSVPTPSINEDDTLILTKDMIGASDVDGDSLSLTIHSGDNYTVTGSMIIPAAHFAGELQVLLEVSDNLLSDTATMSVTVVDTGVTVTINKDSINHWVVLDTITIDSTIILLNKDTVKNHWEIENVYDTTIWKIDTLHDAQIVTTIFDTVALFSSNELLFTSDTIKHVPVLTVEKDTTLETVTKSFNTVDSAVSQTLDTIVTTITKSYFEDNFYIKTDSLLDEIIFATVFDTITIQRDTTISNISSDTLPYIPTHVIKVDTTITETKDTTLSIDSLVLQSKDTLVTTIEKEFIETLSIIKTDTLLNPDLIVIGSKIDTTITFDTVILFIETDTLFYGESAIIYDPSKITKRALLAPNPMQRGVQGVQIKLPDGHGEYEVNVLDPLGNILFEHYGDLSEEYVNWDGTNRAGIPVASGSYLVLIKTTDFRGNIEYYKAKLGVTE